MATPMNPTEVLTQREILWTLARNVLIEFGPPDERLSPAEATRYDLRLDSAAIVAAGAPLICDWRAAAMDCPPQSVRDWLKAREAFEDLLQAVWVYESLRGDLPGPSTAEEHYGDDVTWREGLDKSEREVDNALRILAPITNAAVDDPFQAAA